MYCPICGYNIRNSTVCYNCHTDLTDLINKLKEEKSAIKKSKPRCAVCNIELEHNNTCNICGQHFCYLHIDNHPCKDEHNQSRKGKPRVRIRYLKDGWSPR